MAFFLKERLKRRLLLPAPHLPPVFNKQRQRHRRVNHLHKLAEALQMITSAQYRVFLQHLRHGLRECPGIKGARQRVNLNVMVPGEAPFCSSLWKIKPACNIDNG